MKTLNEVIKAMENDPVPMGYTARLSVHEDIITDALEWLKGYKAHIELDKLRDKCEAENNPLTWAELQTMIGKPVWIEYNLDLENENFRKRSRAWFIIDYFEPYNGATLLRSESGYVFTDFQIGKEWQAYRKERE